MEKTGNLRVTEVGSFLSFICFRLWETQNGQSLGKDIPLRESPFAKNTMFCGFIYFCDRAHHVPLAGITEIRLPQSIMLGLGHAPPCQQQRLFSDAARVTVGPSENEIFSFLYSSPHAFESATLCEPGAPVFLVRLEATKPKSSCLCPATLVLWIQAWSDHAWLVS